MQFTDPPDSTELNTELVKLTETKIKPKKSRKFSTCNILSKPLDMSELKTSNISEQRNLNKQKTDITNYSETNPS